MFGRLRLALDNVGLYIALQKAIGADRVRYRCLDEAKLKPGDRVLDVGCGPAYYIDRLMQVEYIGFDTSERYVSYARRRFGERAEFHCETLTAEHLDRLGHFDAVLLLGLLHHLDDADCATLLDLAARALVPGGRVISCDATVHEGQRRLPRWMSENDRGGYVRQPESYDSLARARFGELETHLIDDLTWVPTSIYMMRMAAPLASSQLHPATG